jgi:hypothetical protein
MKRAAAMLIVAVVYVAPIEFVVIAYLRGFQ